MTTDIPSASATTLDRLVRGGYPEAIRRTPRRRAAFFDSFRTRPPPPLPHQGQGRGRRHPGTPDGRVIAIEVKAGATVRAEDLTGLRHLADRLGPRLVAGYMLYTGQQTLPYGDRLRALPIDVLWQATTP